MTYEELTDKTSNRVNDFMTNAIKTENESVALLYCNAAWGVVFLWKELANGMLKKELGENYSAHHKLLDAINKQELIFDDLINHERVPALNNV